MTPVSPPKPRADEFLSSLPWTVDFLFQGKGGVAPLDDDRRVTVDLYGGDGTQTTGTYRGFLVKVTSKTAGEIARKAFHFADHLDAHERDDGRNDWHGPFQVVEHVGWKWYIAVPRHPGTLTAAVEQWIEAWS